MSARAAAKASMEQGIDNAALRLAVADYLRVRPDDIDPDTPLTAYGLDSLGALELVALLEDRLDRSLPESLLTEWPTLATIADYLSTTTGRENVSTHEALRQRLLEDGRLPDDILPAVAAPPAGNTRRVLLTGATGFLGTALLRSLIDRDVDIVCLVRPTQTDPRQRVCASLREYGLWRNGDDRHYEALAGDLELPLLGLTPATYARLAATVTDISHVAADISWVSAYESLRSANVVATTSLLRLACTGLRKRFQFVSSLSVCFAVDGPPTIDADADMRAQVDALPLGYAQSKCVGESLVRQAAERGLPTQIVRPTLLTGHSESGISNLDDLIAALIKGCIQLGAAPDLDWNFDAVPVDTAADAIAGALDRIAGPVPTTLVLRHPRPRHWTECVLWLNLFGYRIVLEPYEAWTARLASDDHPDQPLRRLRSFFTRRINGRTVPEHYQEHVRTRLRDRAATSVRYPALDAARLDLYVSSFIQRGFIAAPDRPERAAGHEPKVDLRTELEHALRARLGAQVTLARLDAERLSEHSIIGELTSWKRRQQTGIYRCRITTRPGASAVPRDLVLKLKPPDADVLEVAETVAAVVDPEVAREMRAVRARLSIVGGQARELALYRMQHETGLAPYMPACYGTCLSRADASASDTQRTTDADGVAGLALEHLSDVEAMNAVNDTRQWSAARLEAAIDGMAAIHGWCTQHIRAIEASDWIGYVQTTDGAVQMQRFWAALASHAAQPFAAWAGLSLPARHESLVDSIAIWWPALDQGPRTMVHGDFNPRNLAIRRTGAGGRLVAYDWELATVHAPQRDLVELLCFVLTPTVSIEALAKWIERHRVGFEHHSGTRVSRPTWHEGVRSALNDFLVSRLSFYALIDRVKPQSFLPRVVRTWIRMDELVGDLCPQ